MPAQSTGLAAVDHMVGNVQLGKMNHWVNFYHQVMGFRQLLHFDDQDISTEYSALMSKVMQNGSGRVKFPINEPAEGKRKSQIEEYLDYYMGPGVQHVAMSTGDILATMRQLRANGIEFLRVPDAYYDQLPERIGPIDEDMAAIRELGILVDRDDEGYLLAGVLTPAARPSHRVHRSHRTPRQPRLRQRQLQGAVRGAGAGAGAAGQFVGVGSEGKGLGTGRMGFL